MVPSGLSRLRKKLIQVLTDRRWRYIQRTWSLVFRASRRWTVAWLALILIEGTLPAALVLTTKWLVGGLAGSVGAGMNPASAAAVLVPAVVMAVLMVFQRTLRTIADWINSIQGELVQDYAKQLLHDKASTVEYAFFEVPEYLDQLSQANAAAGTYTLSLLQNTGQFLSSLVSVVSIVSIIVGFGFWLPFAIVAGAVPPFVILLRTNARYHRWWLDSTQQRRLAGFYDNALVVPEGAAEVRINALGRFFSDRYQETRRKLRSERSNILRRQAIARFGGGIFGLAITGLVIGWLVIESIQGRAGLDDLAMFYQAFVQGQGAIGVLISTFGSILTNALYLQAFFGLLDRPSEMKEPAEPVPFPSPLQHGIAFKDTRFAYPGTDKDVLKGLNLFIPAGKIVAVVGENGAGKSTLTKLICRFYDPHEGHIQIDGVDLSEFATETLRRNLVLMPQWSIRYPLTADLNIRLGDISRPDNRDAVRRAAEAAGIDSYLQNDLPQGYETILGRLFEKGVDLSGGQWQRVALARAFYRDAPIVILDEPTSYMDPWAEIRWVREIRRLLENKTTLIITHRFTTAMQADLIHVVHDGRVIESGSHRDLVRAGGQYAASLRLQMEEANIPIPSVRENEAPEMAFTTALTGD